MALASTVVHDPVDVQLLIDPSDGAQLVSVNDAAALMQVGRRTVYNWIARGQVEIREKPSGRIYIVVSSLWKRAQESA